MFSDIQYKVMHAYANGSTDIKHADKDLFINPGNQAYIYIYIRRLYVATGRVDKTWYITQQTDLIAHIRDRPY